MIFLYYFNISFTTKCYERDMETTNMPTNMTRRGAVYYARVGIPKEHQELLGKKEVVKSLGTKNYQEARQKLSKAILDIQAEWVSCKNLETEFQEINNKPRDRFRPLDEDLITFIAGAIYEADLDADVKKRKSFGCLNSIIESSNLEAPNLDQMVNDAIANPASIDDTEYKQYLTKLAVTKNILITALNNHDCRPVQQEADAFSFLFNITLNSERDFETLALAIIRAKIAALNDIEARDTGIYNSAPSDQIVKTFIENNGNENSGSVWDVSVKSSNEDIMKLHAQFIDDNPKNIGLDSLQQNKKSILLFLNSIDKKPSLKDFNRGQVRIWRNLLKDFPVRGIELKCFQNLSIREIVQANRRIGKSTISTRTVNKHLNYLSSFCNWLMVEGHIENNPVQGMLLAETFDKNARRPFIISELNEIFSSPLFRGCKNHDKWHIAGTTKINNHIYWLPIIALYTGARLAEIAQSLVSDYSIRHNHWTFKISTDDDTTKSLKNKSSERVIPIHRKLIDLGFITFIEKQKANGETRLFPELQRNKRGQIAATFSRKWGKYLSAINIKQDSSLNFHSFRHTFTDELRRAGHNDNEIGILLGHSQHSTTSRYGVEAQGTIEQRVKIIKSIKYEGFESLEKLD